MKTRSNMPLFVVETTNIKALSNSQIDLLRCGDYLVKKTGKQQHAYKVSYKEDKKGMCLTYCDGTYVETVSYDYNGTTKKWEYNSTDVAHISPEDIDDRIEDLVEGGTLENAKPIYFHGVELYDNAGKYYITLFILSNDNALINSWNKLKSKLQSLGTDALMVANGYYNNNSEGISNVISLYVQTAEIFYIVGNNSTCSKVAINKTWTEWDTIFGVAGVNVIDRVNKIN